MEKQAVEVRNCLVCCISALCNGAKQGRAKNGLDANGKSKADENCLWEDISLAEWCE